MHNNPFIPASRRAAIVIVIAALLLLPALMSARKNGPSVSPERERKADYLFMEAQRQKAIGNQTARFRLLRRAAEVNPADDAIAGELGLTELSMRFPTDSATTARLMGQMKRRFDSNPSDFYTSTSYGSLLTRFGMTDEAIRVFTILDSIFPEKSSVALSLAEVLASKRDPDLTRRAIAIIDTLENRRGRSLPTTGAKVNARFAIGDTIGALSEMKSLIAAYPSDIDILLTMADINMALQLADSAIVYYDRACLTDSTSGPAFYKRANYYQTVGDTARYDQEIQLALTKDNLDLDTKLEILRVYASDVIGDTSQENHVTSLFRHLVDIHPHEPSVHRMFASWLATLSSYDSSAEQLRLVLDIDPSNINEWVQLIQLYSSAGNVDAELSASDDAMRFFPDDPVLKWMRAIALLSAGNADEALPSINRALEIAKADKEFKPEILSNFLSTKGDIFYQLGLRDSSFLIYDEAIRYNPDNYMAMNNVAYYLAEDAIDLDKAEQLSYKSIQHDPDNSTYLDTYAWIMFKKVDYKKAKEYIEKAIVADDKPGSELLEHAGDIYFMNGDPVSALNFWQQALKDNPDNELLQKKVKDKTYYYK